MGAGDNERSVRRASVHLGANVESVPRARSFVEKMLAVWDCKDPDRTVALLTTEVVTNAIRHAASAVDLDLAVDEHCVLLVEAADDHPEPPVLRPLADSREGGRGMWLVERLARRWGVRPLGDGRKVVWFEVDLHRSRQP
ncbi:MAG: ATP-binding protein [Actinomycetota bacterium]|nr:ATP-binding protein [Actinomycetota bacterium]